MKFVKAFVVCTCHVQCTISMFKHSDCGLFWEIVNMHRICIDLCIYQYYYVITGACLFVKTFTSRRSILKAIFFSIRINTYSTFYKAISQCQIIVRKGKNNKLLLVAYKNIFFKIMEGEVTEDVYRGVKINISLFALGRC